MPIPADTSPDKNRLTLAFRDPELERQFRLYYLESCFPGMHRAMAVGGLLVVAFGILDRLLFPETYVKLWLIRFGIAAPTVLAVYVLGFVRALRSYYPIGMMLAAYVTGACITLMTEFTPGSGPLLYFIGICLVISYAYTFAALRFIGAAATCLAVSATYLAAQLFYPVHSKIMLMNNVFEIVSFNVLGMAAAYTMEEFNRKNFVQARLLAAQNEQIKQQHELAESLLLNTLPESIARELQAKNMVQPRYYDDVTILFTDFSGFTLSTESLTADELVSRLNDYFTAFDHVTSCYKLEKLKTIGDSYMCVSGLPVHSPSHAVDALLGAFDFLHEVKSRNHGQPHAWSVRIGLHSGPVISGVVGVKRFAFDVWGDSVNLASRMESTGSPDRINLSASTYARVKDFFACECRGQIRTKEGREYEMYFAEKLHPTLLNAPEGPEEAFRRRYETYFHRPAPALPVALNPAASRAAKA